MHATSIGDYAFLSDCQSAALVSCDDSVDWYCPARFDSPSVFARLLDEEGGHWSIRPAGDYEVERAYLDDTMVLRTEFRTEKGRVALTDALALGSGERGHDIGKQVPRVLLRRVEGIEGEVEMALEFCPRLEYALTVPQVSPTEAGVVARGGPTELHLQAGCPLDVDDSGAIARFAARAGETADFALAYRRAAFDGEGELSGLNVGEELENAAQGWRSWAGIHTGYEGPYAEQVRRSALVLQALTYGPTGAVAAAATTSLPESLGGSLNWDYRFAWLRDLSLTLRALWVAACPDEVERFFRWIDGAVGGHLSEQDHVQIMYGVEGERDLTEHSLEHLQGFRDSRPVRVGNDAWKQKQLDVAGEVVYAVHLLRDQLGEEFDELTAHLVATLADRAAESWREPDAGMWEARDKERHYLTSKVLCWVALDRAIKLAPRLGERADARRVQGWEEAREEVREAILERGWSEEAGAYTGAFGSDRLDASVLMMPLVDFLPATDPRMWATVETVERELAREGLVHRWDGDENGFLLCSYWLVECLARAGEVERATELFERTTAHANDLGLLSEMADARSGEPLGNFPQVFSHVGLVNAAWALSQAQERHRYLTTKQRRRVVSADPSNRGYRLPWASEPPGKMGKSTRKERRMLREALTGMAAGAIGTVALNATTYADMALRGRAASSVPSEAAGKLAEKLGIDLSAEGEEQDGPTAQNRKGGLGALQGYAVGLGLGAAYGLARPRLGDVPVPLAGLGLALAAMAGSDAPSAALGVVDPTTWPPSTWIMDFGFHLPYGLATAVAYEAFSGAS